MIAAIGVLNVAAIPAAAHRLAELCVQRRSVNRLPDQRAECPPVWMIGLSAEGTAVRWQLLPIAASGSPRVAECAVLINTAPSLRMPWPRIFSIHILPSGQRPRRERGQRNHQDANWYSCRLKV